MSLSHSTLPKTIYAIQHVAFEDLGIFEDRLYELGFRVRYFEAGVDDLAPAFNFEGLLMILGGPISAYDTQDFPFLNTELEGLKQRLAQNKPTFGICLGAQLIAMALGAKIYPGHVAEIGWSELELTPSPHNILAPLKSVSVLHWHGDTFDLPEHATLLASSEHYPHQAFQIGQQILALQFHLEVDYLGLEKWFIGHSCELRQSKINIAQLRADNRAFGKALIQPACEIFENYLNGLTVN